jgi:hypothetical protein
MMMMTMIIYYYYYYYCGGGGGGDDDDDDDDDSANNNQDHIHDLVRESTVKLPNNKAKYSKYSKHKVLVMGDSHLRGCSARMTASLDTRFDVCGVVKPELNTESLMEKAKGEVGKFTMNDFLIICSGMNDMERNHSINAFNNITNFIKIVNHTSIILISVPYRHDVTNYLHVNSKIKTFNCKLPKLAKIFSHVNIIEPVNNRLLFTRNGLHLDESGKELLSNQLVLHIFSALEEVSVNSITLGWYDKKLHVNASSIDRPSLTEQAPKCIKKLPVTRNDDFFFFFLTDELELEREMNCIELKHFFFFFFITNSSTFKIPIKDLLFFTKT